MGTYPVAPLFICIACAGTFVLVIHHSRHVDDTERIAAELSRSLSGGECIALSGDLGAGKTQFVRGLIKGLGGAGREVASPTFVLLNVYRSSRLVVYHLDAYRVHGPDDFESIGFAELLEQGGVVVIEWPERISDLLPTSCIRVGIEAIGPDERRITIE